MSDDADPRDVPAAKPVPTELPFWDKRVTLGEVRGAAIHFAKTKQGKAPLLPASNVAGGGGLGLPQPTGR